MEKPAEGWRVKLKRFNSEALHYARLLPSKSSTLRIQVEKVPWRPENTVRSAAPGREASPGPGRQALGQKGLQEANGRTQLPAVGTQEVQRAGLALPVGAKVDQLDKLEPENLKSYQVLFLDAEISLDKYKAALNQ